MNQKPLLQLLFQVLVFPPEMGIKLMDFSNQLLIFDPKFKN